MEIEIKQIENVETYATFENCKVGTIVKRSNQWVHGSQDSYQGIRNLGIITAIAKSPGYSVQVKWLNENSNTYRYEHLYLAKKSTESEFYEKEETRKKLAESKELESRKKQIQLGNDFLNKDELKDYTSENSKSRLIFLSKDSTSLSLQRLIDYTDSETLKKKSIVSDSGIVIKESYLKTRSKIMPYCCGITEFGDFVINTKCEKTINIFLDIIRLRCHLYPKVYGAYSIINYYVDTLFDDILNKRDDLTFVKKFKNPKTKAILNTYVFDNKILKEN